MSSFPLRKSDRLYACRRVMQHLARLADRMLESRWMSYVLVSLVQLKVLWGIWNVRDLTTGDTSSYFANAALWAENFSVNIVWSPLYTSFYGTILMLTKDAYLATTLHRVIIVMAASLAVLALMRKLLPPALALVIAIWWAVLPINFETLYEVHLFALIPILAAWLVAASADTSWHRGAALAILMASAVLVRNELIIAFALYGTICLVRELSQSRRNGPVTANIWGDQLAPYAVPIVLAVIICGLFYWRSVYKYPELLQVSSPKHTVNMCQVYAAGYQQRNPEWTSSPWLDCYELMEKVFGQRLPTLFEMIQANPRAVWEHFGWNASLVPNGLQVSLFNAMSGTVNPDYAPVKTRPLVLIPTAAALLVVIWGGILATRRWDYWWQHWFRERRGAWLIMAAVFCVAGPVILMQRPRPSYLFSTTLVLMAAIGSATYVLLERRPEMKRVAIAAALLTLLFIPSYYVDKAPIRPLYTNYERLRPFAPLLSEKQNRVLFGDYAGELYMYLGLYGTGVSVFDYTVLAARKPEEGLDHFLRERGINVLYVQARIVNELRGMPDGEQLLDQPQSLGWQRVAPMPTRVSDWVLLYRKRGKELS